MRTRTYQTTNIHCADGIPIRVATSDNGAIWLHIGGVVEGVTIFASREDYLRLAVASSEAASLYDEQMVAAEAPESCENEDSERKAQDNSKAMKPLGGVA